MKFVVLILITLIAGVTGFLFYTNFMLPKTQNTNTEVNKKTEKPLDKYTIENLSRAKFSASDIEIGSVLKDGSDFESRVFYFQVNGLKISGQINIPKSGGNFPVILMNRGYIERNGYKTGDGTRRSSEEFVKAGFVTLAPDFLGYGESDNPPDNVMEERFLTYTTSATLLNSVSKLNKALEKSGIGARVSSSKVGLWGHSNGGQITLTVLEISGANNPTVLWAPVSKPFPYSILYYTDDIEDHGKGLRKVVSDFEKDYDSEKYSLTNFLDNINAPLEVHQGTADEAVPVRWTDDLVKILKEKNKDVSYFTYLDDDHNFTLGSWQTVVNRNVEFFKKNLK